MPFMANTNGQQRVVRDLVNWRCGAICSGHHWLVRRIIYDRLFLCFQPMRCYPHVFMVQSKNIAYITSLQQPFSN